MKRHITYLLLASMMSLATGCNIPWSSQLDEENKKLEIEIVEIKRRLEEVKYLTQEIEKLREEIVKTNERKAKIFQDHPGLEEFIQNLPPDQQVQ